MILCCREIISIYECLNRHSTTTVRIHEITGVTNILGMHTPLLVFFLWVKILLCYKEILPFSHNNLILKMFNTHKESILILFEVRVDYINILCQYEAVKLGGAGEFSGRGGERRANERKGCFYLFRFCL